jgi:hypothetical protein
MRRDCHRRFRGSIPSTRGSSPDPDFLEVRRPFGRDLIQIHLSLVTRVYHSTPTREITWIMTKMPPCIMFGKNGASRLEINPVQLADNLILRPGLRFYCGH